MQYRLRTLLVILAIGPPILAVAWERRIQVLTNPFDVSFYIPDGLTPAAKARIRNRFAATNIMHSIAGYGALILYPTAVLLQGKVFSEWRNWRYPPEQTRLARASLIAALLLGTCVVTFFLTLPMRPQLHWTDFKSLQHFQEWSQNPNIP
jgi:hypothetical protein